METNPYPKFVTEKRLAWLNSGQHIKEVAKRADEVNDKLSDDAKPVKLVRPNKSERESLRYLKRRTSIHSS